MAKHTRHYHQPRYLSNQAQNAKNAYPILPKYSIRSFLNWIKFWNVCASVHSLKSNLKRSVLHDLPLEVLFSDIFAFLNKADLGRLALVSRTFTHLARLGQIHAAKPPLNYSQKPQIRYFRRHSHYVSSVAVLSNDRVVSGSWDHTLHVWNTKTGRCEQVLRGHQREVTALDILPDGRVVSSSQDRTIRVWNPGTAECDHLLHGHRGEIMAIAVLPDGRLVSGSHDYTLCLWNLETEQCDMLRGHQGPVTALAVLPDGRVASISHDHTLRVWNPQSRECDLVLSDHQDIVSTVEALPDGRHVVTGSFDHTLRVWDIETGECVWRLQGHQCKVQTLKVLSNDHVISGAWDGSLCVWNLNNGQCEQKLRGHKDRITSITRLPNGRVISGSDDAALLVWNPLNWVCEQRLDGHRHAISAIKVLPDGQVVTGSNDDTLCLWQFPEYYPNTPFAKDDPITQLKRTNTPAGLITQLYSFGEFVERINHPQPVTACGLTFRALLVSFNNQKINDLMELADQQNKSGYACQHDLMCPRQTEVRSDLEHAFNKLNERSTGPPSRLLFFTNSSQGPSHQYDSSYRNV